MGKLITWKHRLTWVGACVGQLPTTGSLGEIPLMTVSRWESKSSYLKLPKPIGWRCYWKWNSFVSEEDLWYGQNAIFKFYFCVESESRASQMLKSTCVLSLSYIPIPECKSSLLSIRRRKGNPLCVLSTYTVCPHSFKENFRCLIFTIREPYLWSHLPAD